MVYTNEGDIKWDINILLMVNGNQNLVD